VTTKPAPSKLPVRIEVSSEMIGHRLDKALSFLPEIATRSRAEYLLAHECVSLQGKPAKGSTRLKGGEILLIDFPEKADSTLQPLHLPLDILWEDSDLLVLNKPAGLVMHPAAGHAQDTLVNALLGYGAELSMKFGEDRPGIVHRLDRDTSGLVVIAKNDFVHEHLAQQFRNRTTHRLYEAVCFGPLNKIQGTLQSYLARHPLDRKKYASVRDENRKPLRQLTPDEISQHPWQGQRPGKWSVTHFRRLKSLQNLHLLELKLETGRTHQIRVHLSENNWPLVQDPIYGRINPTGGPAEHQIREWIEKFPRLALHAKELGFVHPKTGQGLHFQTPWPAVEQALIREIFP